MKWLTHWNDALDELEQQLDQDIDLERLGRLAGCSVYHFQRMFSYLAGVPLAEYIRRRRMTLAAADLKRGDRVLDVALRYGYESPTAFNRAFQNIHGLSPSAARQDGAVLRAFPRIRFTLTVKGVTEMQYQMMEKPPFRIVGFRTPLPTDLEESFALVPRFWAQTAPRIPELVALMEGEPAGVLGLSTCLPGEDNYYYIAVVSRREPPEGMYAYEVPGSSWAVFPGSGALPDAIQALQQRIVSEWLPDSGYEWAACPDIEVYSGQPGPSQNDFQVWLPVVKRSPEAKDS